MIPVQDHFSQQDIQVQIIVFSHSAILIPQSQSGKKHLP